MNKDIKSALFTFIITLFLLSGCGHWATIHSGKDIESPKEIKTPFKPIKAEGKETITKGTDKIIDKSGFDITFNNSNILDTMSISKSNIRITVAHASFEFLKNNFGLKNAVTHPLAGDYKALHIQGPHQAPAFIAYYRADEGVYQTYDVVPFYNCIETVYRDEDDKKLLADFQLAFADGLVKPFAYNDTRTPQEVKTQMERLIGQPYCSNYYPNNIVFYVKVENLGNEKIRLWPIEESVIVDNNNSQYRALTSVALEQLLKGWRERLANLPHGKENPVIGVAFSLKRRDDYKTKTNPETSSNQDISYADNKYEKGLRVTIVYEGLPAWKAGIKEGDMFLNMDGKALSKPNDFMAALSNKSPNDVVKILVKRNNEVKEYELKLTSADEWPRPKDIKLLFGGNVYPNVIYDGFIVFDTAAMLNNIASGSTIKLVIPLIGTNFDASDKPIRSFDFEFDFKMQ